MTDAVIVSTADFQHAPILHRVAEAGKDAYCEKPMANNLDEAKAARDAVLARNLIVQIGTQHRSEPYQIATKKLIDEGALGESAGRLPARRAARASRVASCSGRSRSKNSPAGVPACSGCPTCSASAPACRSSCA